MRDTLFDQGKAVFLERRLKGYRVKAWVKVFGQNCEMIPGSGKQLLAISFVGRDSRMEIMRRYPGPIAALVAVKKTLTYKLHGPHNRRVCHHEHIGVGHRIGIWIPSQGRSDRLRSWRWTTGSVLGLCFQWERRAGGW